MAQDRFRVKPNNERETRQALQRLSKSWTAHSHAASEITNTAAGSIAATSVQAAINELANEKSDISHTHYASNIVSTTFGNLAATNVQAALQELDTEKSDTSHSHTASNITSTTFGNIAATNVQAAIQELDSEKASATHASSHADGGADEVTPLAIGAGVLHGFVNRTDSTLGMSGTTFQVTTASSFVFWVNGSKFTKTTTQSVSILNTYTLHYVYFDSTGTLQVSTDAWDIASTDAIPCATVYRANTTYCITDERHSFRRDLAFHKWAHTTIGARWVSGGAGTFNNTTFSVATVTVADEDIQYASGTQTACRLWYRHTGAAAMTFEENVTTPWKSNGGAPQWDDAGTLKNVDTNRFFNTWVYGTTTTTYPIMVVAAQAQHTTISAARNEALPSILLSTAEIKLLYRVIYRENSGSAAYQETLDYRTISSGPASSYTPVSHTSLTDIGTNTHVQIDSHIASTTNPHSVTASQAGAYYPGGTNKVAVGDGGTGATNLASNGIMYGNGTNAIQVLAVNSTATQKFLAQVSSGAPSWENAPSTPQPLDTSDSPQFTAVNIGDASDTTLSRKSAGVLQVEANELYRQNGTDVAVADGGTGASTAAGARANVGSGAPRFLAAVGSAVNDVTGDGTLYTVIFGSEIFDDGGDYNPSTGEFTAPVTGRYRLSASVALTDCGAAFTFGCQLVISRAVGGRTFYTYDYVSDANTVRQLHINALVDMNAADTAVIKVIASGGTKVVNVYGDANMNSWFCGEQAW